MALPAGLTEQGTSGTVPTQFLTGAAGTGKTYEIRQRIAADPEYGMLAATTGIAAVNLGAITINTLLKYFDTDSLEEAFINGWLLRCLETLCEEHDDIDADGNRTTRPGYKHIVIDEISMMDARQLDIIYMAVRQFNERRAELGLHPLGIVLTGDFCQLSPIKARWAFEAECWPEFEATTQRLTKVWRQADPRFLEAINHIRSGRGIVGATILSQMGVPFVRAADSSFKGTTILAKNDGVDNFNAMAHLRVPGVPYTVQSSRWGEQSSEWAKNIPLSFNAKVGAYVMILSNDSPAFTYVNGDCGLVKEAADNIFSIELVRNGQLVNIGLLTRLRTQKSPPDQLIEKYPDLAEKELRKMYSARDRKPEAKNDPYWDPDRRRWVTGGITYMPLRLAYASTVHKTQGLTLDRVQLDLNAGFMSAPAMCYVALSRCKSPEGLRIIGTPALLGARCKVDPAVLRFL